MSLFLGIDTSNYTTSFAVCGEKERMTSKILQVEQGKRGVRQSDGVFLHLKQMPQLFKQLAKDIDLKNIKAIGVSKRPRNVEGSYMPVFVCGETVASILGTTLGVPLYEFSHQDGHIMAGIDSCKENDLLNKEFFSVHLSGGTLEILKIKYNGFSFDAQIVGGTKDISAGQLIDRTGVLMGFTFPCGKEITKLSMECRQKAPKLSVTVKDGYINFSGAETQMIKLVQSYDKPLVSKAVMECVAKSIKKSLEQVGAKEVLMVGGVASSIFLRDYLDENCPSIKFFYATPEKSCDNAWGIAKLAQRRYEYGA